jgi:hypothetical protein
MAETIDERYLINKALNRIGSAGIGSLTEETSLARQAVGVYNDRVDAVLQRYPFSFTGQTYALTALAKTALNQYDSSASKFITGWREAFALPGTRLGNPRKVMVDPRRPDTPFKEFAIEQGVLYADRTPLWAVVTVRAAPASWSPSLRLAMITILAGDFAVPVAHDSKLAAELLEQGEGQPAEQGRGGMVGQAIALDMAGNPGGGRAAQWNDPLTAARF